MIFYTHERNFGCRLTEYVYKGLRTVTLQNELLRISVLADKGTDIFEFLYKPLDVDFMWRSPNGVRNPATFVPTTHHAKSAFLISTWAAGRIVYLRAVNRWNTKAYRSGCMAKRRLSLGIPDHRGYARTSGSQVLGAYLPNALLYREGAGPGTRQGCAFYQGASA